MSEKIYTKHTSFQSNLVCSQRQVKGWVGGGGGCKKEQETEFEITRCGIVCDDELLMRV